MWVSNEIIIAIQSKYCQTFRIDGLKMEIMWLILVMFNLGVSQINFTQNIDYLNSNCNNMCENANTYKYEEQWKHQYRNKLIDRMQQYIIRPYKEEMQYKM
jgi:hypothetical protein